jgi:lipoate-protein ligase A
MTGIMALAANRGEISAEGEKFSGRCEVASRNRLIHFGALVPCPFCEIRREMV